MNKTVFYLLLSLSATLSLPFSAALAATSTDLSTWTWGANQVSGTFTINGSLNANNNTVFDSVSIAGYNAASAPSGINAGTLERVVVTVSGNVSATFHLPLTANSYVVPLTTTVSLGGTLSGNNGSSVTQTQTDGGALSVYDSDHRTSAESFYATQNVAPVHFTNAYAGGDWQGSENLVAHLGMVDTTQGLSVYTGGTLTLDTSLAYGNVIGRTSYNQSPAVLDNAYVTTDFDQTYFNTSSPLIDQSTRDATKAITALDVTVTYYFAVPEPASAALLGLGCVMFLVRRRRPAAK